MWKICSFLTILWLILPVDVSAQTPRMAHVVSERASLRETPSASSDMKREVAEGTLVKILDEQLPWYMVRIDDRVGWMHADALKFVDAEDSGEPSSSHSKEVRESRTPSSGRTYLRGSRGGCYYLSDSGRKAYVDRSLCN